MSVGLKKLKEKMELQPKYVATQQHKLNHNIFIFDCNSEIDAKGIVSICKKYNTDEYKEKETQSVYAWRSDYMFIDDRKIPEFDDLFNVTLSKVQQIKYNLNLSKINNYLYGVDHYWFAIYNYGDDSKVHNHLPVDLACVYYASVPENSAPLVIPSENNDIIITPVTGMLVVIPGLCNHRVPKSEHQGERIIVAMNLLKLKHKKFAKESI